MEEVGVDDAAAGGAPAGDCEVVEGFVGEDLGAEAVDFEEDGEDIDCDCGGEGVADGVGVFGEAGAGVGLRERGADALGLGIDCVGDDGGGERC